MAGTWWLSTNSMIGCLPTYASISSQSYGATIFFWPPPQGLGTQVLGFLRWSSSRFKMLDLGLSFPETKTPPAGACGTFKGDRVSWDHPPHEKGQISVLSAAWAVSTWKSQFKPRSKINWLWLEIIHPWNPIQSSFNPIKPPSNPIRIPWNTPSKSSL